jgi:peptide/nickel transport system substrate-binding protein
MKVHAFYEEKGDGRMKRFTKLALLAAVFAVFTGMCAGAALAKDSLIVANIYDARTLDPIGQNEVATSGACLNIYDSLLALGPNNELIPQLAEKYEAIDNVTYKFHLGKGVTFHTENLYGADVKYTVEKSAVSCGKRHQAVLRFDRKGRDHRRLYDRHEAEEAFTPF